MSQSMAELCYLFVGANEENVKLKQVLKQAQDEIAELRIQIDQLKRAVDGGNTDKVSGPTDGGRN